MKTRQIQREDINIPRLGFFGIFALIVLVFSVTRGLVPLLTGVASLARPTYGFSFIFGALLSLLGLYLALFKRSRVIPKPLRLLLIINFVLHVVWLFPVVIFNPKPNFLISFAYTGLFPFAIFGLIRIPERYLTATLAIFTLLVAGTVMWDFIELNTTLIPGGFDLAVNRQLLLRPESFEAFGRTAGLMRPVGILGPRPHDAGNLLAILATYWIALLFRQGGSKTAICAISALAISGMLMTQSAANIATFFVGLLFIITAYRRKIFTFTGTLSILTALGTGALMLYVFANYLGIESGMLWQWSKRIGPDGAWGDMMALGIADAGTDLLAVLIGHGSSLGLSNVGNVSEVGFLKMLLEFGLISWVVFLTILIYPAWRYISTKGWDKQSALPYIAALLAGFISLWHYGSVLRTTNEFVFFALYARALKILADERRRMHRAKP